eukprot:818526-Prorocentrum_minimum.AAC.1
MLVPQVYLEDLQTSKGLDDLAVALDIGTNAPKAARAVVKLGPADTHRMNRIKSVEENPERRENSQTHYHRLFRVRHLRTSAIAVSLPTSPGSDIARALKK